MLERLIYVIWCMAWPFQPSSWSTIYPCCHEASSAKPQTVLCKTNTSSEWPVVYSDIYIILINYIIGKKNQASFRPMSAGVTMSKIIPSDHPMKSEGDRGLVIKTRSKIRPRSQHPDTQASAKTTGILETKLHQNRSFKQKILRSRGPAKNPTGRTINVSFFVLSARGFCWSRVGNKQHSQPRGSQAMCPIHALAWYW